ncbi:hypothetical protein WY02_07050 [Pseudonocardia sp. AL041005-10]|nr:hypothetical protein WY02_07050 [Pseudonocardia sp. AL041005-10]
MLTGPGAVPLAQRRGHRERHVERGHQVADRHAHLDRVAVGLPGHAHQPARGLRHDVEPRPRRGRTVDTPARRRGVHQLRTALGQGCVAEPEPLHRARTEVLHDHVGAVDQRQERGAAPLVLEVEDDGLLVAVEPQERGALAVEERARRPGRVAGARWLDLDHPGSEVGELHRRERRGHEGPHLQHEHSGQWWVGLHRQPSGVVGVGLDIRYTETRERWVR